MPGGERLFSSLGVSFQSTDYTDLPRTVKALLSAHFKTEPVTMLKLITLAFAILFASSLTSFASDEWSQFRGPNGTGVSETKGLPTEFGPGKNVVWKTDLPPGHSSPVLTRDRIFVTAHDKEKLFVISLDRQTGKILWQK